MLMMIRGGGFWPGTGKPEEVGTAGTQGCNINIAWQRKGLGDAEYLAAFDLVSKALRSGPRRDAVAFLAWSASLVQHIAASLTACPREQSHPGDCITEAWKQNRVCIGLRLPVHGHTCWACNAGSSPPEHHLQLRVQEPP